VAREHVEKRAIAAVKRVAEHGVEIPDGLVVVNAKEKLKWWSHAGVLAQGFGFGNARRPTTRS
jgi:hypothetical protein